MRHFSKVAFCTVREGKRRETISRTVWEGQLSSLGLFVALISPGSWEFCQSGGVCLLGVGRGWRVVFSTLSTDVHTGAALITKLFPHWKEKEEQFQFQKAKELFRKSGTSVSSSPPSLPPFPYFSVLFFYPSFLAWCSKTFVNLLYRQVDFFSYTVEVQ